MIVRMQMGSLADYQPQALLGRATPQAEQTQAFVTTFWCMCKAIAVPLSLPLASLDTRRGAL